MVRTVGALKNANGFKPNIYQRKRRDVITLVEYTVFCLQGSFENTMSKYEMETYVILIPPITREPRKVGLQSVWKEVFCLLFEFPTIFAFMPFQKIVNICDFTHFL